jgi:hypothetical protein
MPEIAKVTPPAARGTRREAAGWPAMADPGLARRVEAELRAQGYGAYWWTRRCCGSLQACCSARTRKPNERADAIRPSVSWQA